MILPVASLATMPEIVFDLPVEYAVAPTMLLVRKLAPPQVILSARSIE